MNLSGAASALHLKALIYGDSGSGKTTFGVSAPKPLILATERQALVHIQHAMARTGRPVLAALHMETIADFGDVARTLRLATANPELKRGPFIVKRPNGTTLVELAEWPESIVIDSITDACKLIEADIDERSPPKEGKDGLPVRSERFWTVLRDMTEKLLRAFRDVDFHVVFLALKDDRMQGEGDDAVRVVGPALPMRALPQALAATVNVVGVMKRDMRGSKTTEAEIVHTVQTTGPNYMLLKPYRPLKDIETPDFSSWVQRIESAIASPVAKPSADPVSASIGEAITRATEAVSTSSDAVTPTPVTEPTPEPAQPRRRNRNTVTES
jgi:hypothetical protein